MLSTPAPPANTQFILLGDWSPGFRRAVLDESLLGRCLCIFNLEGPVFKSTTFNDLIPNPKAGPHLFNASFPLFRQTVIVNLANNHLFDFGIAGYTCTNRELASLCWKHVGAGLTRNAAIAPLKLTVCGQRVGVLARCETQFGVAQETRPGVAGFDATIYEQIRQLKNEVDLVIVSVHAAAEMVPWPSPTRQDTWRALIDAGADIVHGHHAHVPQGWEKYKGGYIFYGLGNLCVDPAKWSWHRNALWSLAPEVSLSDRAINIDIATIRIEDLGDSIRVREETDAEFYEHSDYLNVCNRPLQDRLLLEGLWQEASMRMYESCFADWLGFDVPLHKLAYRAGRSILSRAKRRLTNASGTGGNKAHVYRDLLRYHLFACDSHKEAISTALGVIAGEIQDLRTAETSQLVNEWVWDR